MSNLSTRQRKTLRNELAKLYPNIAASQLILSDIGLPTDMITFNSAAKLNWQAILNQVENHYKIDKLVSIVLEDFPQNEVLRSIFSPIIGQESEKQIEIDYKAFKSKLKLLVGKNRIDEAFEALQNPSFSSKMRTDFNNTILLLFARYNRFKSENMQGVLHQEEKMILPNQLLNNLLSVIDSIIDEIKN